MENEQIVAVAKAVKDKVAKEAGKEIEPGRYDVDLLVRVLGSFTKGEDFDQKLTAKINFTLLACLALSKVNKETRDTIVTDFIMAMGRSDTSDEHKKLIDQIKDEIQPKLNEIKEMTVTNMSGKITTDLTCEPVGGGKVAKVA
jgi:flagellar basal body-associated protein FliL